MYTNLDDEDKSLLSTNRFAEYYIVTPYDATILNIGCISMLGGLLLTIITLVRSRREEEDGGMDLYSSLMWGPALIVLGCVMFMAAAGLCVWASKKNKETAKVNLMIVEEEGGNTEEIDFINEKRKSGLPVVY